MQDVLLDDEQHSQALKRSLSRRLLDGFDQLFEREKLMLSINLLLIALAYYMNQVFTILCQPSTWAWWWTTLCLINSICLPIKINNKQLLALRSFLSGCGWCFYLYIIVFIWELNPLGFCFILLGIGLIVFIPHFLAFQLWRKAYKQVIFSWQKRFFLGGVGLSLLICIVSVVLYAQAVREIKAFRLSDYQGLHQTYMTEKILGMGIRYHTRIDLNDGWRPPIHEPLLVLGYWGYLGKDPLETFTWRRGELSRRMDFYQQFFPESAQRYSCSCSTVDSTAYFSDSLWEVEE